jgi:hypothetical protein
MQALTRHLRHPVGRRVLWVLFAIAFYQSGLAFTTWVLRPETFAGGWDWLWLASFPALLPAFFLVNRHLGCASGRCASGQCSLEGQDSKEKSRYPDRMPG